jgi:uncharacterized protein with PQ loop repeat
MTDEREKLPLEYPLKQALEIYFKRLIVFVNVVLLNFALLGLLLGITTFAKEPSSATLIMWGVALLILSLITLRQPFRNMISQHMARLEQITVSPALSAVLIFVGLGLLINLFFSFLSHWPERAPGFLVRDFANHFSVLRKYDPLIMFRFIELPQDFPFLSRP